MSIMNNHRPAWPDKKWVLNFIKNETLIIQNNITYMHRIIEYLYIDKMDVNDLESLLESIYQLKVTINRLNILQGQLSDLQSSTSGVPYDSLRSD